MEDRFIVKDLSFLLGNRAMEEIIVLETDEKGVEECVNVLTVAETDGIDYSEIETVNDVLKQELVYYS